MYSRDVKVTRKLVYKRKVASSLGHLRSIGEEKTLVLPHVAAIKSRKERIRTQAVKSMEA